MRIVRRHGDIIMVTVLAVLAAALCMQSVFFPLSERMDFNDSSVYQYIGYLICDGRVPYVDAFDHKGPYHYIVNALGYFINPRWGMWPLICLNMLATLLIAYGMSRRFLGTWGSGLVALLLALGLATSFWDGDTPDFLAVPWVMLALATLSKHFAGDRLSKVDGLLVGASSGVAFWMKPNMILAVVVVSSCVILNLLLGRQYKHAALCVIWAGVGFVVASAPALVWLWANSAIDAMVADYFLFNFSYSGFQSSYDTAIGAFAYFVGRPVVSVTLCGLLVVLFLGLAKKNRAKHSLFLSLCGCGMVSFILCLGHVMTTGNRYENYGMMLYPSLVYVLMGIVGFLGENVTSKKMGRALRCAGVIVLCALAVHTARSVYYRCIFFWDAPPQESDEIDFVAGNTRADDTIAVVSPYYTGFYIATGRDSATTYPYVQLNNFEDFTNNPDGKASFWREYARQLLVAKPTMIIVDKDFVEDEIMNGVFTEYGVFDLYESAGESGRQAFFVLSTKHTTGIPTFVSDEIVDKSIISLQLPEDLVSAYREGKADMDQILELFDEQWDVRIRHAN